ncbi:MAG: copper oxidase [Acidobacteriota bacterium]
MNALPRPTRWLLCAIALFSGLAALPASAQVTCAGYVDADVVAFDQAWTWNRYGALEPQGMMYALKGDVLPLADPDGLPDPGVSYVLAYGQVQLRRDKRPRPLVLRVNVGDCLRIHFTNLLDGAQRDEEQPATRDASIHAIGMQLVDTIKSDGSSVGQNPTSGIVPPGGSIDYLLYAPQEGTFVFHSMGAPIGGEADAGSISAGLFGAIDVEPSGSEWYRSQVTEADMSRATTTTDVNGFPRLNYAATYPVGHRYAGKPILKMYTGSSTARTLVHSDLTAIITGPGAGMLSSANPTTKIYPERNEPFREFTIIFHDEIGAVQAFPQFEDRELQHTLHSVRDAFAINYGAGGAGAEIIANRLGVGPALDCPECMYEEFFLSSWAIGDPAMVVDVPANAPCTESDLDQMGEPSFNNVAPYPCTPTPGRKAKVALYPDDPSNVYHSYLNDHVKFRNSHAGSDNHHIFHLHAHQWLHTPKEDKSNYSDSQAIGQGGSFTYEITNGGSGNLNKTPGDSIFHCHFYPHFAQGMWSLWRVHDVLELGTVMDPDGRPKEKSRALPDNEILAGTPIPGLVPIPVLPMAPIPGIARIDQTTGQPVILGTLNPGYPFFVPGIAGRRAPHPPLDTIHDGGLQRHVVVKGTATHVETRLSFDKVITSLTPRFLAETGEPVELTAMSFHNNAAGYTTPRADNLPATKNFLVNTHKQVRGAPIADPCPTGSTMRYYKAADIQLDMVINKAGWHFPQARMITLWNDVAPTLAGTRPPEPFFFRANAGECIEFWNTNLVPNSYELDDFQVKTPTDILGQHIHLVKFDVLASDGGGNGWNYEDGTFSPAEVRERIKAIRLANGCAAGAFNPTSCPVAQVHPFFGSHAAECNDASDSNEWLGAQTTVQRWYADPMTTLQGGKRTLRTVFTHDHFGPSTHQQVGLYAGLIVEPTGSAWAHNETGTALGTNMGLGLSQDGGPTSWQAVISSSTENYREFMLEFGDFFLAYEPGSPKCPTNALGFADPKRAINPPGRNEEAPPILYSKPIDCPVNAPPGTPGPPAPCPEAVSADDPGTKTVNYRNEPLALRVLDQSGATPQQYTGGLLGRGGDLSFAYETRTDRWDPEFNTFPYAPFLTKAPYGPLTDPSSLYKGDPYTPLLRTYEGDTVKIRVLVGAHEESHNMTVHGMKWLREAEVADSGWRNSQGMGISEWFDLEVGRIPALNADGKFADFLYKPGAATESQWDGLWGLIRAYRGPRPDLRVLESTNPDARGTDVAGGYRVTEASTAVGVKAFDTDGETSRALVGNGAAGSAIPTNCPSASTLRHFDITAVSAAEVLRNDGFGANAGLIYNRRPDVVNHPSPPEGHGGISVGPLHQSDAIMFVYKSDLDYSQGRPLLIPSVRREPLVLRARAGECIEVKLNNDIPPAYTDLLDGFNGMPMIVENFNADQVKTSLDVGLHPQLVAYDIMTSDGTNVGLNPAQLGKQTVAPGEGVVYYWYAGSFVGSTPLAVEFGGSGLTSSDPIKHASKGAIGALIIEPPGSTWTEDLVPETDLSIRKSRASAVISPTDVRKFREFVVMFQDDLNLRFTKGDGYDYSNPAFGPAIPNLIVNVDSEGSGQKAINYRTEPLWFRAGWSPETSTNDTRNFTQFHQLMENAWIHNDPETPVFQATKGDSVRMRVVHPGGHELPIVFDLHGHVWEEYPVLAGSNSTRQGSNPVCEWKGTRDGMGASDHFDALLKIGAGGMVGVTGDYLYRDYTPAHLDDGLWGLFRVK